MANTGTVPAASWRARDGLPRKRWPARRIVTAVVTGAAFALAVGVPTGLVPTPVYARMTPVLWWNYPVWAVSAVLGGLVVATYVRRPQDRAPRSGASTASGVGVLAAFAVGCPVCNKLVVAALGASGAMTFWAPLQPALGVLSVLLLAWALRRRLRNEYACSVGGDRLSAVQRAQEPVLPLAAETSHRDMAAETSHRNLDSSGGALEDGRQLPAWPAATGFDR